MGCAPSNTRVLTANGNVPYNNRKLDHGQRRQGELDHGQRRQGELDQRLRRQELHQGQRRQGELDQRQRRQGELHQGQRRQGELDQRQRRQGEPHQGQQDQAVQVFFPNNYTGIPEVAETPHLVNILPNQEIPLRIALQVVDTGQGDTAEEIVRSASPDGIGVIMRDDLDVIATNIQVRQGSVIIDMNVIGWESLEKLLKSSKNGQLEKCLKKVLLTPDITKGKDMSLKMHIVNEDKLRKLVKLMKLLYVKDAEKGNAQSSESVRFTFCPERRMWFWTPYLKKHIWMEVSYEEVQGGPLKGHVPEDKYLEIIRYLQQEKPTLKANTSTCVICDLVPITGKVPEIKYTEITVSPPSAGTKNRTTGMEGGASGTQHVKNYQNMSVPLNRKDKLRASRDSGYGSPRDPPDASGGDQGGNQ